MCAVPTFVMTATSGLTIAESAAISPGWFIPISKIAALCSLLRLNAVSGTPSWLLRFPKFLSVGKLSESAYRYAKELLGKEKTFSVAELGGQSSKTAGSEDFAYISQRVPSIMIALAAGKTEKGYIYGQHHPKVKFDEDALPYGSAIYAYNAIRWLEENQ